MNSCPPRTKKTVTAILCADLGTSSIKAALIASTGTVLAHTRVPFNVQVGSNRWLDAFKTATATLLETTNTPVQRATTIVDIQAISISGNGPSFANEHFSYLWHEPLTPYIDKKLQTMAKNGHPCRSLFIPRLMHIKKTMPDIWDSACQSQANSSTQLFSLPEYLVYQLVGKAHTLLPEKRYAATYWSIHDLIDHGLFTTKKAVSNALPPFKTLTESAGNITPDMAQQLHIQEIPVFCSGPDFISALLGTATITPGILCDRAGSSEGINLCTKEPLIAKNIRNLPSVIPHVWNASCLIPDSGIRFSIHKKQDAPHKNYREYVHYVLKNPTSSGYKLMHSIAVEIKQTLALLENTAKKLRIPCNTIICTGGQVKNPEWMQFKANILNKPLHVTQCNDAELVGCAVVALTALGWYSSIAEGARDLVKIKRTYNPTQE